MTGNPMPQRSRTRRVYDGRLLKVDVDTVRAPDGGEFDLELIRHPGAAAVVRVGDAVAPRTVAEAIREGRAAGLAIGQARAPVTEGGGRP